MAEEKKNIWFFSLLSVLRKNSHLAPNKEPGSVEDVPAMGLELDDCQSSFPIQATAGF